MSVIAKSNLVVEELQLLYSDLQQTTGVSSAPSQKLANTALRSARKLIEAELNNNQVQETTPPPLPVRPSPAPPSTQTSETSNVSVTIEPVNDSMETASAVSSQTLVDDDLAMSAVVPVDTEDTAGKLQEVRSQSAQGQTVLAVSEPTGHGLPEEPTLDEKFQLISQRLEKSDRKGTDQQDVDEVMGFILEHLMRAITSKGPMSGKTDMQADIITDTFFPLIVNYTLKSDENLEKARAELNSDRWINIVPSTRDGGAFSIHDAIVRSWGIQYPESSNLAVFTAIRRLSPVIHIRIARAKEDGTKNNNPIVLTDELYFDRHMDVPHDSEFAGFRKAHWALIGHQAQLESLDNKDPTSITVPESQAFVASNVDHNMLDVTMHCWGEDVTTIEDNIESILSKLPIASTDLSNKRRLSNQDGDQLIPARKKSLTPEAAGTMGQVTMAINQKCLIDERIDEDTVTKDGVEDYFDTLKQHKYRLHAVICHSGGARAGHYWVWIRDFNRNLWIKYNDSTVTIDRRDPQAVIDDLSMSGDPCYVAYVRDEDKDNIVGIPRRSLPPPSGDVEMQTIDGIAPDDHEMPDLVVVTGDKHTVTNNGITEMDDPRPYQLN